MVVRQPRYSKEEFAQRGEMIFAPQQIKEIEPRILCNGR
jgi:hypothetical protein